MNARAMVKQKITHRKSVAGVKINNHHDLQDPISTSNTATSGTIV